jgi:hypothetical protein
VFAVEPAPPPAAAAPAGPDAAGVEEAGRSYRLADELPSRAAPAPPRCIDRGRPARKARRDYDDEEDDRPRRRRRKQTNGGSGLLVGLLIGGGVLLLVLLAGCGVGAWWAFGGWGGGGVGVPAPFGLTRVTPENYYAIQPGMTVAQVQAILGPPTQTLGKEYAEMRGDVPEGQAKDYQFLRWQNGLDEIEIKFHKGVVADGSCFFSQPSGASFSCDSFIIRGPGPPPGF